MNETKAILMPDRAEAKTATAIAVYDMLLEQKTVIIFCKNKVLEVSVKEKKQKPAKPYPDDTIRWYDEDENLWHNVDHLVKSL